MNLSTHFHAVVSGNILRTLIWRLTDAIPSLNQAHHDTIWTVGSTNCWSRSIRKCNIFLPKRYAELVRDDDIEDINSGGKPYKMVYKGKAGFSHILNMEL